MRMHRPSPAALAGLLLATLVSANPFPRDDLRDVGFGYLQDRACASYCGASNQFCCSDDETCVTANDIATCTAGGGYVAGTSTWTVTYTSTWSSYIAGATTPASSGSDGEDCVPPDGTGQIACGTICCADWQYCAFSGQCSANAGAGTWTTGTTVGTTATTVTTGFSAPYRVTGTGTTATSTGTGTAASATATSTGTGAAAVSTTSNNSLSGGAIAGIVIGTIAGVILLLLLCVCCIIRGFWHTFLAIFGLGKKKNHKEERTEIIEERYSRHGSRPASARPAHRTWFGGAGGGRPSTVASRKEKKSSGAGWLATAGGATLLLLGLKRGEKHKEQQRVSSRPARSRSDWSSSYYTDSYTATDPSKYLPSNEQPQSNS
ncbi:hypothetical protein KJ359_005742 [Pestalotiopsis sp. 9143b]|nr:hypothetical protein KJ359_005742 [Pestalotiopsis sp. 9143b]